MTGSADNDTPSQPNLPPDIPLVPIEWGGASDDPSSGLVQREAEYVSEEGTGPDGRQRISFVAKARGFQDKKGELDRALAIKVALQPEAVDEAVPTAEEAGDDPEPEDLAEPEREVVVELSLEDTNKARKVPMDFLIDPSCSADTHLRFRALNGTISAVYVRCIGGSIAIKCGVGGLLRVIYANTGRVQLPGCASDIYVRCRSGGTVFYLNIVWVLV
jgi:hypothetical protein